MMMVDPYRHQETQYEYYEPARMHRPMMSSPAWTFIAGCLVTPPVAFALWTWWIVL